LRPEEKRTPGDELDRRCARNRWFVGRQVATKTAKQGVLQRTRMGDEEGRLYLDQGS
jgi:hypothetical protein